MAKNLDEKRAEALIEAILSLKNRKEAKKFLGDLMTSSELTEFSNRWAAALMLDANISYEKIEKITGLSSRTIARVSSWLKTGTGGYKFMLRRMGEHSSVAELKAIANNIKE